MRRKRTTAGFTLVEVLVSSLIIAFLLVSLLASLIAGRSVTQVALNSGAFVAQMIVSRDNGSASIKLVLQETVPPFDSTMEVRVRTAVKPRVD